MFFFFKFSFIVRKANHKKHKGLKLGVKWDLQALLLLCVLIMLKHLISSMNLLL